MRQQARNETNDIDKINVDSRLHGNDKKTGSRLSLRVPLNRDEAIQSKSTTPSGNV